jgi:hypothetical protein
MFFTAREFTTALTANCEFVIKPAKKQSTSTPHAQTRSAEVFLALVCSTKLTRVKGAARGTI